MAGSVEKNCTAKEGATCTIDGLLLRVPYKVCVRACHAHSRTATTVSSSFADAQLVSSGDLLEFVANSGTGDYTCSDAVCSSANIPMQAPSNIQLAVVNQTAVKVTWTAPGVKKAMDVVAAYVAGSVEKNCTAKEGAECTIDGLLLRIPYTVCVRACQRFHSSNVIDYQTSFIREDCAEVEGMKGEGAHPGNECDNRLLIPTVICSVLGANQTTTNNAAHEVKQRYRGQLAKTVVREDRCLTDSSTSCPPSMPALEIEPYINSIVVDFIESRVELHQQSNLLSMDGLVHLDDIANWNPRIVCLKRHYEASATKCLEKMASFMQLRVNGKEQQHRPCKHLHVSPANLPNIGFYIFKKLNKFGNGSCSPRNQYNFFIDDSGDSTMPSPLSTSYLQVSSHLPAAQSVWVLLAIYNSTQLPEIIKDNPTHNSIEATWNLLPNASTPHQYTYTVCAKPEKSTEGLMVCCYTSKTNSCTVTHLIANTAYNVTIDACFTQNPKLCSLKSEPLVVYTKPVPLDVRVSKASTTDIVVTWKEPTSNTELTTRYEVGVTDNLEKNWTCEFAEDKEHKCRIAGLSACLVINVTVRACARDVDSVPVKKERDLKEDCGDFALAVPLLRHLLCIEDGKIKCTQYWPDGMTSTFESEKCTVEVRKESEENFGSVIRRELKIHPSSEASPWTVTQFHFTGWVDNDAPNVESFYNLVVMQNDFLATHPMGVKCGPTVVHCSAGVGRTGTFMAARFLLDRLRTNPQNVDIVGTVLAMRKWRANLVQVWSQLQFLYNFIDFCLGKENLGVKPIAPGPKALPAAPSAEYKNVVEDPQVNAMKCVVILVMELATSIDPSFTQHSASLLSTAAEYANYGGGGQLTAVKSFGTVTGLSIVIVRVGELADSDNPGFALHSTCFCLSATKYQNAMKHPQLGDGPSVPERASE
ncbi:Tyrosine-protein phosphatase non-receptor [Echinococcus granulosus]|uniref:Tyrosine-protein phosphatase non-receptor n=1 Tax=Echinococcus granulosus TaxID=6210 RepID=W6V5T4_ECHGR|nr:Tyrosine-protein phosphatase non-receptor [Echinococcus granulosus]EUB61724.1 Tyrosine-protein phosphatase non-receptor [Echinococcus granulosus]